MTDNKNTVLIEIPEIYDGWCLSLNKESKEIEWRDHWAVNKLSLIEKQRIEKNILKNY